MSSIGQINLGPTMDITEWGKSYWEQNTISEEMMSQIDREIKKILDAAYAQAVKILTTHKKELEAVAEELVKKENLDQDEFEKIVGKKK
jgi:cell division protease FtsH